MPDLRTLETFFWVAQLGSFRGASERLHTTQPAVSVRIAALEKELGVRLLERGPRLATLTAKGRLLLDYAERFLRLRAEMMSVVAEPGAMSGVVRLGVAETIVHTWLSRYIERVHAIFPKITLDIEVDVSPNLRNALVEHQIDLAFLLGPISDPNISNHDLCRYPLAFVASPKLDLGRGPVTLERLTAVPIITYPKTTRPYIALRELLGTAGLPTPRIYGSSSLSTIVRMTLDGIGISVIPPVVIAAELARGDLRIVKPELQLADLAFTCCLATTPDSSPLSALAKLACDVAEEDRLEREPIPLFDKRARSKAI
jgi:DNA-binding transcriptional LysR family regulator